MGSSDDTSVGEMPDRQSVSNTIQYVEKQIERGVRMGVDLDEEIDTLAGARLMLDMSMVEEALQLADRAREAVGKKTFDFQRLMRAIQIITKKIEAAENDGQDVEEASQLLEKAKDAIQEADYKRGLRIVGETMEFMMHGKRPEPEQKIQLADWQK